MQHAPYITPANGKKGFWVMVNHAPQQNTKGHPRVFATMAAARTFVRALQNAAL